MKKILLFLLIMVSTTITGTPSTLPAARTLNCIILNDTFENPLKNHDGFFWNRSSHFTMTNEFLTALHEYENPILVTKSLWCTMQWFAQLWHDFSHLDELQLKNKYKQFSIEPELNFIKNIAKYAPAIRAINEMYEGANNIININRHRDWSDIDQIIKNLYSSRVVQSTQKFCSSSGDTIISCKNLEQIARQETVRKTFFLYLYFKNIDWTRWQCHEINQHYLLFVPQTWETETTFEWVDIFNGKVSDAEMNSGLKGLSAPKFEIQQQVALMNPSLIRQFTNLPKYLGEFFLDALSKTFLLKSDIKKTSQGKKSNQRLAPWLLPSWNIFFGGHGSPTQISSGLSIVGDNSEFNKMLNFFNYQVQTKFLAYSSCYPAGSKLQTTFGFTNAAASKYLSNISFIVMALGITLAPTTLSVPAPTLPPFTTSKQLGQFIFIAPDKSYGTFFPTSQFISFKNFFYQIQQKKYKEANHAMSNILDYSGNLNSAQAHNIALIRVPHAEWLTPIEFDKEIMSIQQIEAITKESPIKTHPIASEKYTSSNITKMLLMFANYVPRTLQISRHTPHFIPMNLFSQHYYFKKIEAPHSSLTDIIKACFAIQESKEPFTYYIENLTTNKPNTKYTIILRNEQYRGSLRPTILYIQDIKGVKTVKHYSVEIADTISFTALDTQTEDKVHEAMQLGKTKSLELVTHIKKIKDTFDPKQAVPEIVRRSWQQAEDSAQPTSTQKLLQCNEILQLLK